MHKSVIGVLSVLSLFRSLPTHPKISLESILAPFKGLRETFSSEELKAALKDLNIKSLRIPP